MTREADYTIKGFLYQFNITLEQILLSAEGSEVTVEGIIEDIDVTTPTDTKAIQCKYHETKSDFKLSDISKPILQMLVHYSQNQDQQIQYILYAHFANEQTGEKQLLKSEIESILETKNQKFISSYISILQPTDDTEINAILEKSKKTKDDLKKVKTYYQKNKDLDLIIGIDAFLKPERFKFIIGDSLSCVIDNTTDLLTKKSDLSKEDVQDLFYPNAIQIIANKSINHDPEKRTIEKAHLINELENSKKVAISRWTKELKSYNKLLKNRRNNLKSNLQQNHRLRYFLFDAEGIENFDKEIVNFIADYLNKYHHKIKLHSKTPVFCIKSEIDHFTFDIQSRLFSKEIRVESGYKGKKFFPEAFHRAPERIINKNWFEFHLRLCQLSTEIIETLNNKKCHDFFIIGKTVDYGFDLQDINVEHLDIKSFQELKYLQLLTDTID